MSPKMRVEPSIPNDKNWRGRREYLAKIHLLQIKYVCLSLLDMRGELHLVCID